ncbi:PTS system glucose-specific IIA component [Paenibacillus sp. DS2015]
MKLYERWKYYMFGWSKKKTTTAIDALDIVAPIKGEVVSLENVPDPAFSTKAMGEGVAIIPSEGKVTAPFAGKIVLVMEKSKHALMLEHESGVQALIHIGINTVSLKGNGFTLRVSTGDEVKAGQLLLEFDIAVIEQAGLPIITPIIIPDGQEIITRVEILDGASASEATPIMRIHL